MEMTKSFKNFIKKNRDTHFLEVHEKYLRLHQDLIKVLGVGVTDAEELAIHKEVKEYAQNEIAACEAALKSEILMLWDYRVLYEYEDSDLFLFCVSRSLPSVTEANLDNGKFFFEGEYLYKEVGPALWDDPCPRKLFRIKVSDLPEIDKAVIEEHGYRLTRENRNKVKRPEWELVSKEEVGHDDPAEEDPYDPAEDFYNGHY